MMEILGTRQQLAEITSASLLQKGQSITSLHSARERSTAARAWNVVAVFTSSRAPVERAAHGIGIPNPGNFSQTRELGIVGGGSEGHGEPFIVEEDRP